MADKPLYNIYTSIHNTNAERKRHGERYNSTEKDVMTYEFLSSGQSFSEFKKHNMTYASKRTIQRHLQKETKTLREGVVDVEGLKQYLESNKYPMSVMLIEDGTKVQQHVQYDSRTNCVTGLVSPLDKKTGLPDANFFKATCALKIKEHIESCAFADTAYVQLALPLAKGAAPYVLFYVGTDNKFSHQDVMNRWKETKIILLYKGIKVIGFASDGDPKLLKAMLCEIKFLSVLDLSKFGPWFIVDSKCENCYVQDEIHISNKMKNKLLNSDSLKLGTALITKSHLQALVDSNIGKDKHGLTQTDLNAKDRMKFGPTERMMKPEVREYLQQVVPDSHGTIFFLKLMSDMHSAFCDVKMQPLQRVFLMWYALFVLRCWRNDCRRRKTATKECVTPNVYAGAEINAHAIVLLIEMCRDDPEQFLILCFSSQPAEELFRELRSMTTTLETAVEFSMRELGDRIRRAFMKVLVSYRQKTKLTFPNIIRKMGKYPHGQLLPSAEDIRNEIERARVEASHSLSQLGLPADDQVFTDSLDVRGTPKPEFVSTGEFGEDENADDESGDIELPELEFVSTGQINDESGDDSDDGDEDEDATDHNESGDIATELEFVSTVQINEGYEKVNDINLNEITSAEIENFEKTHGDQVGSCSSSGQQHSTSEKLDIKEEITYNATDLFKNFAGELKLKSSTASDKHTFLIRDEKGKVHRIKISKVIWMMTGGRSRQVNTRLQRYRQKPLKRLK